MDAGAVSDLVGKMKRVRWETGRRTLCILQSFQDIDQEKEEVSSIQEAATCKRSFVVCSCLTGVLRDKPKAQKETQKCRNHSIIMVLLAFGWINKGASTIQRTTAGIEAGAFP